VQYINDKLLSNFDFNIYRKFDFNNFLVTRLTRLSKEGDVNQARTLEVIR